MFAYLAYFLIGVRVDPERVILSLPTLGMGVGLAGGVPPPSPSSPPPGRGGRGSRIGILKMDSPGRGACTGQEKLGIPLDTRT